MKNDLHAKAFENAVKHTMASLVKDLIEIGVPPEGMLAVAVGLLTTVEAASNLTVMGALGKLSRKKVAELVEGLRAARVVGHTIAQEMAIKAGKTVIVDPEFDMITEFK